MLTDSSFINLNVLDNVEFGVQIIDKDYRYRYLNNKLLNEIQMNKNSIIGKTMSEKFPGIEKTDIFKAIKETIETNKSTHITNEFVFPDGRRSFYELAINPIESGVIIFTTDVTKSQRGLILLQESNEKLEQKVKERTKEIDEINRHLEKKIQERTLELEHFAYMVAHDLRKPCSQLLSLSDFLHHNILEENLEGAKNLSNLINQSSRDLLSFLDSFRALTHLSDKKIDKEIIHLGLLFDEVYLSITQKTSHRFTLINEVKSELSIYKYLIILLFRNIILNAQKFTPKTGPVELIFTETKANNITQFSIKNTYNEKVETQDLTTPFVTHASDTTSSGLGLNICKRIIDFHHGEIKIESDGQYFHVIFTLEGNKNEK